MRIPSWLCLVVVSACGGDLEAPGSDEADLVSCADSGAPKTSFDCHPRKASNVRGAWFRKVTSHADVQNRGLVATIRLPAVTIDRARWFMTSETTKAYQNGPLDRPSVYVGGRGGDTELDAGLSWDRVYDGGGRPTFTDALDAGSDGGDPARRFAVEPDGSVWSALGVWRPEGLSGLVENFAFRPFWRCVGAWGNPAVGAPDNFYWYPGETARLEIRVPAKDQVALSVVGDFGTTDKTLACPGYGRGLPQSFKRVVSIDQFTVLNGKRVGLETAKLEVLPTATTLFGAAWSEVTLLGPGGSPRCHIACGAHAIRGADAVIAANYDAIFRISSQDALGAETIDIVPGAVP